MCVEYITRYLHEIMPCIPHREQEIKKWEQAGVSSAAENKDTLVCQNFKQYKGVAFFGSIAHSITYNDKDGERHNDSIEISTSFIIEPESVAQPSDFRTGRDNWRKTDVWENNTFEEIFSSTVLLSLKSFFWWWFSRWRALHRNKLYRVYTQKRQSICCSLTTTPNFSGLRRTGVIAIDILLFF